MNKNYYLRGKYSQRQDNITRTIIENCHLVRTAEQVASFLILDLAWGGGWSTWERGVGVPREVRRAQRSSTNNTTHASRAEARPIIMGSVAPARKRLTWIYSV